VTIAGAGYTQRQRLTKNPPRGSDRGHVVLYLTLEIALSTRDPLGKTIRTIVHGDQACLRKR
jgi:hypothetical protein